MLSEGPIDISSRVGATSQSSPATHRIRGNQEPTDQRAGDLVATKIQQMRPTTCFLAATDYYFQAGEYGFGIAIP